MNILVLCTCPDDASAGRLADALVIEKLAACVNALPGLRSTYVWQGEVCRDAEVLLVIKTTRERFTALEARVLELHPYEVPEIIALPIEAGHKPYLDWLQRQVGG